jgi:hypothetical protein
MSEANDYAQDYRQGFGGNEQRIDLQPHPNDSYPQAIYVTPAPEHSPQPRTRLLEEDSQKAVHPGYYNNQQLHQYPPHLDSSLSPQRSFMGDDMNRPSTPGYYPDRAPKREKLTEEQKKIVDEFPTDLDEENGSLLKTTVASVKDWRSWLKWKYIREYKVGR